MSPTRIAKLLFVGVTGAALLFALLYRDRDLPGPRSLAAELSGASASARSDRLAALLREEPLATSPLLALAMLEPETAVAATDVALRRDPRTFSARRLRATEAIETGRYGDAMAELLSLRAIDPERSALYYAEMTRLTADREGQATLLSALDARPDWAPQLAEILYRNSLDPTFLLAVAARAPMTFDTLVATAAERGGPELALSIWLSGRESDGPSDLNWPNNGDFAADPAAHPFDWTLEEGADLTRRGTLYLVHRGVGKTALAYQTISLGPGRYSLDVVPAEGRGEPDGSVAVTVACPDAPSLVSVTVGDDAPMTATGPVYAQEATGFTVSRADCAFQRLAIEGRPSGSPGLSRVEIDRIAITRLGPEEAVQ